MKKHTYLIPVAILVLMYLYVILQRNHSTEVKKVSTVDTVSFKPKTQSEYINTPYVPEHVGTLTIERVTGFTNVMCGEDVMFRFHKDYKTGRVTMYFRESEIKWINDTTLVINPKLSTYWIANHSEIKKEYLTTKK